MNEKDLGDRLKEETCITDLSRSSISACDYQLLFENAPGLFLVVDADFRIIGASQEYLRATMTVREEILEHDMFEVFPDNPDDRKATGVRNLRASFNRVLRYRAPDTMAVQKYDIRQPKARGGTFVERYWSPVNSPILDEHGYVRYIIHRVEDVTEFVHLKMIGVEQNQINEDLKKRAVQMDTGIYNRAKQVAEANFELKHLTSELEETSSELKAFTYSVSHDLRGPIRRINGFIKILSKDLGKIANKKVQKDLDTITTEALRLDQLVVDLLNLSRAGQDAISPEHIDMRQLVLDAWQEAKTLSPGRNIEFSIKDLPEAVGSRNLLRQIWVNLLNNAVKYTRPCEKPMVEVAGGIESREVIYSVRDNGTGFNMKYRDKLFQPFARLHGEEYEGTGIGLAVVRRIVDRHGGRVWTEGKVGKGATFYFSLPKKA